MLCGSVVFVLMGINLACEAGDATVDIKKYLTSHPEEAKKFIVFRLTSVKTERISAQEHGDLLRRYYAEKAKAEGKSAEEQNKVAKKLELMRSMERDFFASLLRNVDEDDPIYWYKYKVDGGKGTSEQGYMVVKSNGDIEKISLDR